MKTVAIIPIRKNSTRIKLKALRNFGGKPLYQHFLEKLVDSPFNEVHVDTDVEEVADFVKSKGWSVIERLPELTSDTTNGNDLLLYDASQVEADIYFQFFITAPLLLPETIRKAHKIMTTQQDYDSLFTAIKIFSWFWYDGNPVNYDPKTLPRSQDATPIIRETTGLYAIRKETLLAQKCRIGKRPYMLFVDEHEAADLDTEIDFRLSEFLYEELRKKNGGHS